MQTLEDNFDSYLQPTYYLDFEHPDVQDFVKTHTKPEQSDINKAIGLYYAVRDGYMYSPYNVILQKELLKASYFVKQQSGYCVEKANLLASGARAVGIPSRMGYAIVRNHIGTERLEAWLKTDKLVFHGFVEMHLDGKWVKATPAFNKGLCDKLGVSALEFDGREDSIFQEYDREGGKFMDYIHDYGIFADLPFEKFCFELKKHYAHLWDEKGDESENT